jgi:hypothetical protein
MIPNENVSQVRVELERIERALRDPQTDERYCQLYAAQQALAWALSPSEFMSPFTAIQLGRVRSLTGTLEGSEDCQAARRLPRSSDTYSHCA